MCFHSLIEIPLGISLDLANGFLQIINCLFRLLLLHLNQRRKRHLFFFFNRPKHSPKHPIIGLNPPPLGLQFLSPLLLHSHPRPKLRQWSHSVRERRRKPRRRVLHVAYVLTSEAGTIFQRRSRMLILRWFRLRFDGVRYRLDLDWLAIRVSGSSIARLRLRLRFRLRRV
uniref:Uncharacterized protein n=1 Tax=Opuntia streptacantha TaxID=393608 RepID=A0A7C9ASZ4_OPUST